jgi:hypothetical protein
MHFQSDIVVTRSLDAVTTFFDDPQNLVKWDRSVARIEPTSSGETSVGFTFDTFAPNGQRLSYRITAHEPGRGSTIELMPSKIFQRAIWVMRYDQVSSGTRITCEVDFTLRPHFFFLLLPLVLTQRKALARDLASLKRSIEAKRLLTSVRRRAAA